jgi:hypothetical protein
VRSPRGSPPVPISSRPHTSIGVRPRGCFFPSSRNPPVALEISRWLAPLATVRDIPPGDRLESSTDP